MILLLSSFKYVDNYEVGYKFNKLNGEITILDRTGYHFKKPFIESINTIDLRPTQVCISTNARVLNCKLVSFNKKGLRQFIDWHGREDYRIDVNRNYNTKLEDLLKTYAYSDNPDLYDFLIIKDIAN